jgi:hypothetical protein
MYLPIYPAGYKYIGRIIYVSVYVAIYVFIYLTVNVVSIDSCIYL